MSKKKSYIDENETIIEDTDVFAPESDTYFSVENDEDITEDKPIDNIKTCKIIKRISKDKVIIDFDGYGIVVSTSDNDKKHLDIKFNGTIGKSDFTFEVK